MLFPQQYVSYEVVCSNYVIIIVEMILIQNVVSNLDHSKTVSMLFVFEMWSMTAPTKTEECIPS